jgi:hypothetical protein
MLCLLEINLPLPLSERKGAGGKGFFTSNLLIEHHLNYFKLIFYFIKIYSNQKSDDPSSVNKAD